MSSMPLQPKLERRHGQSGVLVKQCDQRIHVVAFERLDIPTEKLEVEFTRLSRRGVEIRLIHSGAGPAKSAIDGVGTGPEEFGDFFGFPAQNVAQYEHCPLARLQVLHGGDKRQPDRLPLHDGVGGISVDRRDQAVRNGLHPGCFRPGRAQCQLMGCVPSLPAGGGGNRCRQRPPVSALQHVQANVGGDPVEPGTQAGSVVETGQPTPGPDERLLHRVLGVVRRGQHPVAVSGELPAERLEFLEGGRLGR